VAAFALIHGGGGSAWDWHLVAPTLRERGHDPVAVDLPSEDESAGWSEYTDTVVRAVGDRSDLVVVGIRSAASRRRSCARASQQSCSSS
jgi:pimeloyl-ACP methyl ester carboxylesterase